jgi:hypothetical protein
MRRTATMKARAALVVVLIGLSGAGLLIGKDGDPCREVYLQSGLAVQRQVSFQEFRQSYSDVTLCAMRDPGEGDGLMR